MSVWIFILIAALCLFALFYFFRPFLKKIKFPKISFKKKEKHKKEKNIIKIEKEEEKKVDSDVQVEESNLDYDGFFKTDYQAQDENFGLSETVNNNYDGIFDDLFVNSEPKRAEDIFSELKDSELKDYFSEDYLSTEDKDITKVIQDLPPEVKAMIFANLLDKKEDE